MAWRGSQRWHVSGLFEPARAAFLFIILDQTEVSAGFIFRESIPRGSCDLSDDIFPSSADVDIYGFALKCLNSY